MVDKVSNIAGDKATNASRPVRAAPIDPNFIPPYLRRQAFIPLLLDERIPAFPFCAALARLGYFVSSLPDGRLLVTAQPHEFVSERHR